MIASCARLWATALLSDTGRLTDPAGVWRYETLGSPLVSWQGHGGRIGIVAGVVRLPAWRVHLGMPMCGARMVDDSTDAIVALMQKDALCPFCTRSFDR